MIPTNDKTLFAVAIETLREFHPKRFKGRLVLLFLGLKFYENQIPSIRSASFLASGVLEGMLDDLYAKGSRHPSECVLNPFQGSYLPRTGILVTGNAEPQNTWRNNYNLQKGVGCYADSGELESPAFLAEQRIKCPHLEVGADGKLKGGVCNIPASSAKYRGEENPKWLRLATDGSGLAVIDMGRVESFAPHVAPEGVRLPLVPLVVALYHDALPGQVTGQRSAVSIKHFAADFNLSEAMLNACFDTSAESKYNATVLAMMGGAALDDLLGELDLVKAPVLLPVVVPPPTEISPPISNSGWDAEQMVLQALTTAGWQVTNVSRSQVGYDLHAVKGHRTRFFEVKSSVGLCAPLLTAREWGAAVLHGDSYVLAIIDNFAPGNPCAIHWIVNPAARCRSITRTAIQHSIPRSGWLGATSPLESV